MRGGWSFEGRGGLGLIKRERGGRGGQLNLCVETIHYFEGINVTVLERMHQFIMYIPVVYITSHLNSGRCCDRSPLSSSERANR